MKTSTIFVQNLLCQRLRELKLNTVVFTIDGVAKNLIFHLIYSPCSWSNKKIIYLIRLKSHYRFLVDMAQESFCNNKIMIWQNYDIFNLERSEPMIIIFQ